MTTIKSLPSELLSCIFAYIHSIAQLAACRLVCRKWNVPAETSMFGKEIKIKSEEQAIVLYACLFKDPSKGRMIKHLDFNIRAYDLPVIYYYLLDLAFTPTIEQMTGVVQAEDFFTALGDIADDTVEEFSNLKTLPKGPNQIVVLQTLARLNVRSLTIGDDFLMSNAPMLGKFSNLTELTISGYRKDRQNLETILKPCRDLLVLKFVGFKLSSIHGGTTTTLMNWLATRVEKQTNLQRLEIENSTIEAGCVEYLKYKYPNIKVTKCYGYITALYTFDNANVNRILNAMKGLHVKQATLALDKQSTLIWFLEFTKSREEDIKIYVDQDGNLVMKVNFAKKKN